MQAFAAFLTDYLRDLNHLSDDGWALLVEGKRDEAALRQLGFRGILVTKASFRLSGRKAFGASKKVVVLTDLDREGSLLASRYVKELRHEGLKSSLSERHRLKRATRGVFLHIENLSRFADSDD